MTPHQFVTKWSASSLKERSGSQEHFIDICRMLGEPTPGDADPHGKWFCFERGAIKTGGGKGWADVWRKSRFAWEYKGKHKDLGVAFSQLQRYAIALENPPLLVVSDMERIQIHTNFTNTVNETHVVELAEIGSSRSLHLLKCLFNSPDELKPGQTKEALTEKAAQRFAALAHVLRERCGEPERVAHFLNRILFCLFAQDAKLLPNNIVIEVLESGLERPEHANAMLRALFAVMKKGGHFGSHIIDWFNGSLFDSNDAILLSTRDIRELLSVASLNWTSIEPSIFGTLFERGLDPAKRAQIGAHYTDPQSIMRIVSPTVVEPLAAQWEETKQEITRCLARSASANRLQEKSRRHKEAQQLFDGFLRTLAEFRVLDPACGSGNFLYLCLQALKDLEHRASLEAEYLGLEPPIDGMHVGVRCLRGIELNSYAAELARVTVWIGEIQWMLRHGIRPSKDPILKPLETIECRDALLNGDGTEATWPNVNAIVGNPPFLGNKRMLSELGERYTTLLRRQFSGRLPGGVELVTYFFEKARAQIARGEAAMAGLVSTQSIRKGANRTVLDRISESTRIFSAWRDEPWVNDGAAVRVSFVSFGNRTTTTLDGSVVSGIASDLSVARPDGLELTSARPLPINKGVAFQGTIKTGPMEIAGDIARGWLTKPNPHGRPNSDVLRPWANGQDLTGRWSDTWIIDFGSDLSEHQASLYELPFEYLARHLKASRRGKREPSASKKWWLQQRPRPEMRAAMKPLSRFIATPRVSKHRFFVWLPIQVLPDSRLYAICKDDDVTFGVLSSRIHAVWSLAQASRHGDGDDGGRPTYNAADCFEAFPFPQRSLESSREIATAARRFNKLRDCWLNPEEWTQRAAEVLAGYPDRILPRPGCESELKKRTMTDLYNDPPAWLVNAHAELDQSVARAYRWTDYSAAMPDDEVWSRILLLNHGESSDLFTSPKKSSTHPETNTRLQTASPQLVNTPGPAALKKRLAVVCTLVNRLADDKNFGRTKMAKLFYLVDATQDLDLDTSYQRQAAGPLDPKALYDAEIGLEALATKYKFLSVEKSGRKVTYRRGPNLSEALESARVVLGARRVAINRIVDRFRKLDTDQCEIVATLYACWNDRILESKSVSDDAIADEFLEAWHEKKRRFARPRLFKALHWMRDNKLVPTGKAAHTIRRRASKTQ